MKKKTIIKIFLITLYIFVNVWIYYVTITNPLVSASLVQNDRNEWIVEKFYNDFIEEDSLLKAGDVVLEVDGVKADEVKTIKRWGELAQASVVTVSREGEKITVSTENSPRYFSTDYWPVIGQFITLFVAIMLYIKLPYTHSAKLLSLLFFTVSSIFMSLNSSIKGDLLGKNLISVLIILLPVLFLHFMIVLFNEKNKIKKNSIYLRITITLYIFIGIFFITTLMLYPSEIMNHKIHSFILYLVVLFFICGIIVNFLYLVFNYVRYRSNKYLSSLIKAIFISLIISFFPLTFLFFIPQYFFGGAILNSLYAGFFVLFFPISFAYLIGTKRLYDIDIVVRRILATTALAVIPSALLVGIGVMLLDNDLSDTTIRDLTLSFFLFLIIISTLLYSMEYLLTRLEPILFPRKHMLQKALDSISKNLRSISTFRELREIILVDIVGKLEVSGGAVLFQYVDKDPEIISEGEINLEEMKLQIEQGLSKEKPYAIFEVNQHEEYTSYLVLADKKNGTAFGMEEIQWLQMIATYLAVSLENLHLIRKLNSRLKGLAAQIPDPKQAEEVAWFRKLMFDLQEEERTRIATDLHDTTMQDLFFLKRRILGLGKTPEGKVVKQELRGFADYVEIINVNLRQSCFELHPYLLNEIGLVHTVKKFVGQENAESALKIELNIQHHQYIDEMELEKQKHIFRIIQELINNAKKHSQASVVLLKLYFSIDRTVFKLVYEDNGVGYNIENVSERQGENSGIGLDQMRTRVFHLGGKIRVQAKEGQGVKYKIWIPVQQRESLERLSGETT